MDKDLFLSRTQTLLEQGAYDNALDEAKRWLDRNPGDVEALIVQCQACMRLGKLEEATAVVDDVEMTILGLSRIYACMGDICFKGGLNQEAVKFYRRFVSLNPGSDLSRDVLGKLRILEDDHPELIQGADAQEISERPATAGFQTLTIVDLYLRQGHVKAAEALLEQMLAKEPDNSAVLEKLADVQALVPAAKALNLRQREKVVEKLSKWLDLLQRKRLYAI